MAKMTTPSLIKPIKPFTPSESYDFPFTYVSGSQATQNNLIIEEVASSMEVYNSSVASFSLKHPLPVNTLTSGSPYRAKIRVGDANNNFSDFSEWVFFWVLEKPELNINNIDYGNQNRVYSQTVTFTADYTHPNNESLQSFRYNLYDSNKNLLKSFNEKYQDGSLPLEEEVTGLVNGELYYIELKIITVNLQELSTGLILVRPFYTAPVLTSAIGVENIKSEGAIKVTANIIQVIGKLYDQNGIEIAKEDIEYVDNEKLDMNRVDYARLVFDEGFDTDSDEFVLKLWCQNLPDTEVFMKLFSSYGWLDFRYFNDMIHIYKHQYNVNYPSYYTSNEFSLSVGQGMLIYVKGVYNSFDIKVTPI